MPVSGSGSRRRRVAVAAIVVCAVAIAGGVGVTRFNIDPRHAIGDVVDTLDGVAIHYNGGVSSSHGRTWSADRYNIGVKYQCVEFVKRYYFERFGHKMPDPMGNAVDFFDKHLLDGETNGARGLRQFRDGGFMPPAAGDIIVFDRWMLNPYGHVAIVAAVDGDTIEIAQQNPGPFRPSRERFALRQEAGAWSVAAPRVLGWLRRPDTSPPAGVAAPPRT